ncbi:MAG: hypothetical protein IPP29_13860 [Bacteroidetes bacterium]|nr:hypothetical protein [Bacteroidota bacterium]
MHTGPLVAGVVGEKVFVRCVWRYREYSCPHGK